MDLRLLGEVGFEEKEAEAYVALLRLGPSPASEVSRETGRERTSTYYLLLRMLEKGYVSETVLRNVKTFAATDPARLLDRHKEQEAILARIIPQLDRLKAADEGRLVVEVRQGKEGFRHLYRDAVAAGDDVLGLGIDDQQYVDLDRLSIDRYYRDAEAAGIRERLITYDGAYVFGSAITQYRTIPKRYFQPTPTIIYGDRVVLISWVPTVALIFVTSRELADAYRKHFEFMWTAAKPYRKRKAPSEI